MKATSPMEKTAREIAARLRESGHIAYLAGGCVRDIVRGETPKDFDIATDAKPEIVQKLFPRTYAVGAHFGVILVVENGFQFEVATFRSDDAYIDGRHPSTVHFSSPKEDAKRRDFTINGMFYDPLAEKVFDFVGGRADIEAKLVRAIGDPAQRLITTSTKKRGTHSWRMRPRSIRLARNEFVKSWCAFSFHRKEHAAGIC